MTVLLTAAFPERMVQVIPNLILITFLMGITFVMPPVERFDQIEQIVVHAILWVAKLFLAAIVIDDTALIMNGTQRWALGFVALIAAFIVIVWNTGVILYKFVMLWVRHFRARRDMTRGIALTGQPTDRASLKSSIPPAMQQDFDGSNRIIGFDEERNQLCLSSRINIVSEKDATGFKKMSQLDKYIEPEGSHWQAKTDNEALTFANSNVYLTGGNRPTALNAQANTLGKGHAEVNQPPIGDGRSDKHLLPASQRFSEQAQKSDPNFLASINSRVLQESRANPVQPETQIDEKLRSLNNIGSVRSNLNGSQAPQDFNMSLVNSITSDRFHTVIDPVSLKEVPRDNFSKKKDTKMGELLGEPNNVIIEENSVHDTFVDQVPKVPAPHGSE